MEVILGELNIGEIGYKASSFAVWNATSYQAGATNDKDWSGLYVAEDAETAKGYVPDCADQKTGNGTAYLFKVSLKGKLKLITCMDESFKEGNIDMKALKEALSEKGIPMAETDLLMPKLGTLGYAFKCYNNSEGGVEIIIPNVMVDEVTMVAYEKADIKGFMPKYSII